MWVGLGLDGVDTVEARVRTWEMPSLRAPDCNHVCHHHYHRRDHLDHHHDRNYLHVQQLHQLSDHNHHPHHPQSNARNAVIGAMLAPAVGQFRSQFAPQILEPRDKFLR